MDLRSYAFQERLNLNRNIFPSFILKYLMPFSHQLMQMRICNVYIMVKHSQLLISAPINAAALHQYILVELFAVELRLLSLMHIR